MSNDWLTGKRADILIMANTWINVLVIKGAAWGVPAAEVTALSDLTGDAENALEKATTTDRGTESTALCYFVQRYLIWDPVTAADRLAMGLPPHDLINTPGGKIKNTVAMGFRNDPRPGTHTQYTDYWISGSESKSKGNYQMAVFQICIQGPGEPEPRVDSDEFWSLDHSFGDDTVRQITVNS
jgi:hypothetical protein